MRPQPSSVRGTNYIVQNSYVIQYTIHNGGGTKACFGATFFLGHADLEKISKILALIHSQPSIFFRDVGGAEHRHRYFPGRPDGASALDDDDDDDDENRGGHDVREGDGSRAADLILAGRHQSPRGSGEEVPPSLGNRATSADVFKDVLPPALDRHAEAVVRLGASFRPQGWAAGWVALARVPRPVRVRASFAVRDDARGTKGTKRVPSCAERPSE